MQRVSVSSMRTTASLYLKNAQSLPIAQQAVALFVSLVPATSNKLYVYWI